MENALFDSLLGDLAWASHSRERISLGVQDALETRQYGLIVRREGHNQEIYDLQALPESLTGPSG